MMKKSGLISGILGLAAALVYFASMADYAFPGESAGLIALWRGLGPAVSAPYPLMAVFARLLGGGNLLAPVCGVLAVVALFHLVRCFVFSCACGADVRSEGNLRERASVANLAGLVAAVVFLLTPAVRSAATHLEPRLFDFAWALLVAALALPFRGRASVPGWIYPVLAGLAWGLGLVDSALFLVLAPLDLMLVAHVARSRRAGAASCRVPLALFVLSGVLSFLAAARAFGLGFDPFLRRTLLELASYYRMPGWFFVFAFTTLPFLTVLFSEDGALGEKPGPVQLLFHAALSFVAILAVVPYLSPSALMEPYGCLPVATSAFAAAVAGYLVAYWWVNRQTKAGRVTGGLLALALAGTSLWNLCTFDGKAGAFADEVARRIVADLGGRRTLVTDGALDSHIRLAAEEAGTRVDLVPAQRFLDEKFRAGLGNVTNDVAVFAAPDLLHSAGFTPVPEFVLFGADERRVPDWSAWKSFDRILAAPAGWCAAGNRRATDPVGRLRLFLRRHFGRVANDRGVFLRSRGKDDAAFGMYELVLNGIDRDNVSTLLNELEMAGKGYPAAQAKKADLERRVRSVAADRDPLSLWRLGATCGYLGDPDAAVRLGFDWARSGRPGAAAPKLLRVSPEDRELALDIARDDRMLAARHAKEILGRSPDAPLANYVMGSLALADGRTAEAEAHLRKAADARDCVPLALNDLAEVLRRAKRYAEAERYARKCVACAPTMYVAWETLGSVLMDAGADLAEAESAIRRACELSKGRDGKSVDVRMLVSLARVQLKRGDVPRAQVTIRKIQTRRSELSETDRAEFEKLLK